jgi:small subunit ribosomal protein S20
LRALRQGKTGNQESTVANSAQARKRARQSETRRQHNAGRRSMMRTHMKKVLKAVAAEDREAATSAYREAVSLIDRSAKSGLLHKNAAARYKSRLNNRVRSLSA